MANACYLFSAVVFVFLAWGAFVVKTNLDFVLSCPLPTSYIDNEKCQYIQDKGNSLYGAEDIVLGKNGIIITSSLDSHHFLSYGRKAAGVGGLFAFDSNAATPQVTHLQPTGFPGAFTPVTHGLFLSSLTDRLYVVCHWGHNSTVEIFDVTYPPTAAAGVSLAWVRSVSAAAWPAGGLNDVVEGRTAGELYVSQWLHFSIPEQGKLGTSNFLDKVKAATDIPIGLLQLKYTNVYRCSFTDDAAVPADCEYASDSKFVIANGLATDPDRTKVFVVDPPTRTVSVMGIDQASGALTLKENIETPYPCDNIAYEPETGALACGAITDIKVVFGNLQKPLHEHKNVSGGLLSIRPPIKEGGEWQVELELAHDGSLLSQVSAALHVGHRIVMGSPFSPGILICDPSE